MKFYKNTELARLYNVSEKSVRNWIQAAMDGKLDLQLYEKDSKFWIANTRKNAATIEQQVEKGKKFINRRALKIISPTPEFYEAYDEKQIIEIISSLSIRHEIPTQFSYVDGAAYYWDQYATRLSTEELPNILTQTIDLLSISAESIDRFSGGSNKINVVDLGPGNGLPIRATLARLLEQGRLDKYIAIDDSKEMLAILEKNIQEWFGGRVSFEGHVLDFSHQRFDHIFAEDYVGEEENVPLNLVFLLGGTLNNFRNPNQVLQTINQSLGMNDMLIYSTYLDTDHNRRYFDFNTSQSNQKLRTELILEKLGIQEDLYELEQGFSERERARYILFRPTVSLMIEFKLKNGTRLVELRKNQPILLWRHWHKTAIDIISQFDQNSFDFVHASRSDDQEYLLTVSRIKSSVDSLSYPKP
jgi:hypothetical protein